MNLARTHTHTHTHAHTATDPAAAARLSTSRDLEPQPCLVERTAVSLGLARGRFETAPPTRRRRPHRANRDSGGLRPPECEPQRQSSSFVMSISWSSYESNWT